MKFPVDENERRGYTENEDDMKKTLAKSARHHKASSRKAKGGKALEFERGWNELEAQHDRLKTDWMSLAVQLGIGGADKAYD